MKLKTARVTNYKSVIDSEEFTVTDLTCLVGKNESGKTAILEALTKLNPVESELANFDADTDYPRVSLSDYQESGTTANVVATTWALDRDEIEHINTLVSEEVLTGDEITVFKGYDNQLKVEAPLDYGKACRALLDSSDLSQADRKPLEAATTTSELYKALNGLEAPSDRQSALLAHMQQTIPTSLKSTVSAYLTSRLPRFLYYDNYYSIPGQVSANELVRLKAAGTLDQHHGLRVFVALLSMVGTTPEGLTQIDQAENLISKLEGVENRITDTIFKYWSQNRHLEIRFLLDPGKSSDPAPYNDGNVFRTRVRNKRHRATIGLENRSTGFIWFFSFLVWFSQVKKEFGDNLIILLDEPGLSLHATAQADLLRYMNAELVPNHQVIYTTHSPFMIDPSDLLGARTVEDVVGDDNEVLGTKVGEEVLSTDRDTLFPLQAALGYDITQTLFVGPHTLLVEGPSDLLYIQWASDQLRQQDRSGLDPRWTVTPCGGITKVPAFLSLFGGNDLHVAVLVDYAKGDKRKVEELRASELLQENHVFTPLMYQNDSATEADTEDMLGRPFYVDLVNATYSLTGSKRVPKSKPDDAPSRIIAEVQAHFRTLAPGDPEFDHYSPARHLVLKQEISTSEAAARSALGRFERLFIDLNNLLE